MEVVTDRSIEASIAAVRSQIKSAELRRREIDESFGPVHLVAVSKTKPVADLMRAYGTGQRIFGENYVQELIEKAPQLPDDVCWHFIGNLQSNKAKVLVEKVPNLTCVETVDDQNIATKLNNACASKGRRDALNIYLQVNTSGEESKSGTDDEQVIKLARFIKNECPNLMLKGLMTIGAPGDLECFDRLYACRGKVSESLGVPVDHLDLSMGMSGDFEEAILRGSTSVRIGSTIFGARNYCR